MTYNAPFVAAELLVSVRSAGEAVVAASGGVTWIDVKNPGQGSLGMPAPELCRDILNALSDFPEIQTSVALGELDSLQSHRVVELMSLFSIGKVGLAGLGHEHIDSAELLARLHSLQQLLPTDAQLVPAIYADGERARAPGPDVVLDIARRLAAPYVLIDTWQKDGRGLFDWFTLEQIGGMARQVEAWGSRLVVAGSLRTTDWPKLQQLGPVIVGIRGAVCQRSSDRTTELSKVKLSEWQAWLASTAQT